MDVFEVRVLVTSLGGTTNDTFSMRSSTVAESRTGLRILFSQKMVSQGVLYLLRSRPTTPGELWGLSADSMNCAARGPAACRRIASSTEVFPTLFRPVRSVIGASSGMLRCRKPRKRSIWMLLYTLRMLQDHRARRVAGANTRNRLFAPIRGSGLEVRLRHRELRQSGARLAGPRQSRHEERRTRRRAAALISYSEIRQRSGPSDP